MMVAMTMGEGWVSDLLEVQLILCDSAQADATGKVHMLGAGWSITSTPTMHAVALLIKVPWDRADQPLPLRLQLLDADGQPVRLPTPEGFTTLTHEGTIQVSRTGGAVIGSMLDASFALNVPPLPLRPGRYEWRLELAEHSQSAFFTVRP
jgi:hypothetical protein